jgi:ribose/xylose/arabinose/galactoside ABC-type transport system permease subunit
MSHSDRDRPIDRTGRVGWMLHPAALLALTWLVTAALQPAFFAPDKFVLMLARSAPEMILTAALTVVLMAGRIDLSLGAVMGLVAVVASSPAVVAAPWPLRMATLLGTGAACGVIHGWLIGRRQIPAFLATGSLFFVWEALARAIQGASAAACLPAAPLSQSPSTAAVIATTAGLLLTGQWILTHTLWGPRLRALGSHPEIIRRAGLSSPPLTLSLLILSGTAAATAALLDSPSPHAWHPAANHSLSALAAALLGGARLRGGHGSIIPGAIAGVLIVQSLTSHWPTTPTPAHASYLGLGLLLAAALSIDAIRQHSTRSSEELWRRG